MITNSLTGEVVDAIKRLFINNPIKKQPITLTSNVPMGKSLINILLNVVEHKYLTIEPKNPPMPIDNKIFNLN